MASSLGRAYVEVEANADKVGPEIEARFSAALQTIAAAAETTFEGVADEATEAADSLASSFEDQAGQAASAVGSVGEAAGDSAAELASQFDQAAGDLSGSVEGAADSAQSALEGIDPGDPFSELADSAGSAADEAGTALVAGITGAGIAEAASEEGDRAGEGLASAIEGKEGRVRQAAMLVGAAAAAGIAAAGGAALAAAMSMDDAVDTIRIGTGASGDALDGLMGTFENLARTVPSDLADVSTTVADLNTRMGLTGPTLEKLAAQVLQAGNMQGVAVDVGALTSALAIFGVKGDQSSDVLDTLFQVSQATGVGMNDLTGTLAKSGAQLTGLGFTITDAAALLGTLDKAGIDSGAAAATLGKSLVTLAKDGEAPEEAFRRVTGEIGDFIARGDQAGALDLASQVFGTRGAAQMVAALQSGAVNLDNLTASAGLSSDTILGLAEETGDFPELWQKFQNSATLALAPLGERLFPLIADGIGHLTTGLGYAVDAAVEFGDWMNTTGIPALQSFAGFMEDNATVIGIVAGIIAAIFIPHLIALGVNYAIAKVQAISAWTVQKAQAIAGAASHSWAILSMIAGWVALAAQAVVSAVVTVAQWTMMGARAAVQAAIVSASWIASGIATVASMAVTVAAVVGGWILMGAQALLAAAQVALAWLIAIGPIALVIAAIVGIVVLIVANWETIKTATAAAFQWVVDKIKWAIDFMVQLFLNFTLVGLIIKHWDTIKQTFLDGVNGAVGFVTGLPGRVLSALGNLGSLLSGAGRDLISGFVNGIANAAGFVGDIGRNVVNSIVKFINSNVINRINNLLEFKVGPLTIDPPDLPQIPALAEGAIVNRPTLALIGEDGPEVVLPLSARRAARRDALMGEAGLYGEPAAAGVNVTYAPALTVPRSASAPEVAALVGKDFARSVRLGLLDGSLGTLEAAS